MYGILRPYLSERGGITNEEIAKPKKYADPSNPRMDLFVHVKSNLSGSTKFLKLFGVL